MHFISRDVPEFFAGVPISIETGLFFFPFCVLRFVAVFFWVFDTVFIKGTMRDAGGCAVA
jgi:hypothetical protein